jgi:formiminotetrahydrofolate cyclodeaminase
MYKKSSLQKYLDDLAARLPAPGGGSAVALAGALGCGLLSMACNFTVGKEKYKDVQGDIKKLLRESEKLRREFLRLVDLDVAAYKSKDLRRCLDVPCRIAQCALAGLQLCRPVSRKANRYLLTDLAAAARLLEASFFGARIFADINLKYLKNPGLNAKISRYFSKYGPRVQQLRKDITEYVDELIRG